MCATLPLEAARPSDPGSSPGGGMLLGTAAAAQTYSVGSLDERAWAERHFDGLLRLGRAAISSLNALN